MMKDFLKYVVKGLLSGLGFGIALLGMAYIYDNFVKNSGASYQKNFKEEQTKYLKSMISAIDKKGPDLCEDIEGVWIGKIEEEGGRLIREFESHYKTNGEFEGKQIFKTISSEEVQLQKGTWECRHSILFNKIYVEGSFNYYNYLIFHNENGERVYATIGRYSLPRVYKVTRQD